MSFVDRDGVQGVIARKPGRRLILSASGAPNAVAAIPSVLDQLESNWARSWHRALESVGQKQMRVYDCRHAAATTWLRAGMPLGETERRSGYERDATFVPH